MTLSTVRLSALSMMVGKAEEFSLPTFADGLYSPIVTNKRENLIKVAKSVSFMADHVGLGNDGRGDKPTRSRGKNNGNRSRSGPEFYSRLLRDVDNTETEGAKLSIHDGGESGRAYSCDHQRSSVSFTNRRHFACQME